MISEGDVVIVHEDNKSRTQWRLAIVEKLIKGNDDQVRAAHIRMSTHSTTRPVAKLYPLEVQDGKQNITTTPETKEIVNSAANEDIQKTVDATTHTRAAASKAIQQIKEWKRMLGPAPAEV